ncbi:hypothetical protein OLMES_1625 [Oleiphilus messinensis]|uniref:Putative gamma-glutamylcyclotransferase n=1 Tax=Oleiphilus messinensis TaxID=141451 RepID=A0A1Y0I640_9GAMM|nr:hypothetical protein OLMES_1625 [Oleiphilus messinensis]
MNGINPSIRNRPSLPCFVYGTLLIPDVIQAVLGRLPDAQPARLQGYGAYLLKGQVYPAIRKESPLRNTSGLLYHGLCSAEWQRLDDYEGQWYQRKLITVLTGKPPLARTQACTYILRTSFTRLLTDRPWDLEHFKKIEQSRYLETIRPSDHAQSLLFQSPPN